MSSGHGLTENLFTARALADMLSVFRFTTATLIVVSVVGIRSGASRSASKLAERVLSPRVSSARLWVLPIYVWALEATLSTYRQFNTGHGWFGTFQLYNSFYTLLALALLVAVQSGAVLLSGHSPWALGTEGAIRGAASFAIMGALLDAFFCLCFGLNWFPR